MYIYLSLISALGWGISPIIDKIVLQNLDYTSYVPVRLIIRATFGVLLGFIFRDQIKKNIIKKKINNKVLFYTTLSAFISFLAGITYFKAISFDEGNLLNIALISYVLPIIIISILSSCIFGKKVNKEMIMGMLITFLGIYIVLKYSDN